MYESSAEILVDPSFEAIIQYESVGESRASEEGLQSLERAFVGDSVLVRVVEKLGLRDEPGFLPPGLAAAGSGEVAAFLREKRVEATLIPDTRVIRISVEDPVPERAHRIAAALTTEFEEFVADQRRGEGRQALAALERQAEATRAAAMASEAELQAFRDRSDLPVQQDYDLFSAQLARLEAELGAARREAEGWGAKVAMLDAAPSPVEVIKVAGTEGSSHVSELMTAEATARTRLEVVSQRYLEKHPNHIAAVAELRRCEDQLRRMAESAATVVRANAAAAERRAEQLSGELAKQLAMVGEVKANSSEFRVLQQKAERSWQALELLQQKLGECAVAAEQSTQIGTVVSEPMVPSEKSSPDALLHIVLGGAAGTVPAVAMLLVGLLSGFPFSHPRQLAQRFGLPVIADWSDASKVEDNPRPAKLLSFLAASSGKIVQVSAPGGGAQARQVAMRMARLSAEHGRRTLLIAVGEGLVTGAIEPSGLSDLKLLSLSTDTVTDMSQFPGGLQTLRRDFQNIIIEAGAVPDPDMADYLSYHADLDVVVVHKDQTRKPSVDERVRRCGELGSSGMALVMVGDELSP